ncbi:hypothetical protein [Bifidobacterium sp. M0353]|uniref:hypothetical protein n=1 Tax=Bifidobacterium sp. M0353 TaxID=2751006 RepID=UPI0018DB6AA0|nr:hypothetical protein [Bifidobacterium sp. M0353]MBI0150339.1 hypothetical protein [Bifidobacterium sp. M0353]
MKPISRRLTISIKDEDTGVELGSATAEFNLPTAYTEIRDIGGVLVAVAPRVHGAEFEDRITSSLEAAAGKLGE